MILTRIFLSKYKKIKRGQRYKANIIVTCELVATDDSHYITDYTPLVLLEKNTVVKISDIVNEDVIFRKENTLFKLELEQFKLYFKKIR